MAKKKIDYNLARAATIGSALNENKIPHQGLIDVDIEKLHPNPFQPRLEITDIELNELANSIKANGLLQPIIVTQREEGGYTIIAGHRRVLAIKRNGSRAVKSVLMEKVEHVQLAILPLVENLQRSDTSPIENAISMSHILNNKIVSSQNELAEMIGLSKSMVSKLLSLLKLPQWLIDQIKKDKYSDIVVLTTLNKVDSEKIKTAYSEIKDLNRNDALNVLNTKFLNLKSKKIKQKIIEKTKRKFSINLAMIPKEKEKQVRETIELLENLLKS